MTDFHQVMSALLKGQECAAKLNDLLKGSKAAAEEIGDEILSTFSRAISAIEAAEKTGAGGARESDDHDSEVTADGGGGVKRKYGGSGGGGCRRRTRQSACRTVRRKTLSDGQAWRKYGQKQIHNSKHPRSYFRCTHKFDQGCQAHRQVQPSEEDSSVFIVTYIGEHTCVAMSDITETPELQGSSCLISFASKTSTSTTTASAANNASNSLQDASFGSALVLQQTQHKQEGEEEVFSSLTPGSSPAGYDAIEDFGEALKAIADQGDVTSSFLVDSDFMFEEFLIKDALV